MHYIRHTMATQLQKAPNPEALQLPPSQPSSTYPQPISYPNPYPLILTTSTPPPPLPDISYPAIPPISNYPIPSPPPPIHPPETLTLPPQYPPDLPADHNNPASLGLFNNDLTGLQIPPFIPGPTVPALLSAQYMGDETGAVNVTDRDLETEGGQIGRNGKGKGWVGGLEDGG
ncbi:hypothetical protein BZA77DRAFT_345782 [Pyronema omphalodes]|nr:hypothetical protein BZA77DRAFT_345782 [Pyronema omphalodes]